MMIKLKEKIGLSISEIKKLINNRKVLILGYSVLGKDIHFLFKKYKIEVMGFLSTKKEFDYIYNLPVFNLYDFLDKNKFFIVIASRGFLKEAKKILTKNKFVENKDFLTYLNIQRNEAVIDVSGKTNLSYKIFVKLYTKMKKDREYLRINFGEWYDPLQNYEILNMIKKIEDDVLITIKTPLNCDFSLIEQLIKTTKSSIKILIYGDKKTHNLRYGVDSWDRLKNNLLKIITIKNIEKIDLKIELAKVKNIAKKDIDEITDIVKNKIPILFEYAYPFSYETFLNYYLKGIKDEYFQILNWDIDYFLKKSFREKNKPCVSQRIFPVINSDLSVNICHLYNTFTIIDNYLNIDWKSLVKIRQNSEYCNICQQFGLHRLDLHLLTKEAIK